MEAWLAMQRRELALEDFATLLTLDAGGVSRSRLHVSMLQVLGEHLVQEQGLV